jgi:hypothetical protein
MFEAFQYTPLDIWSNSIRLLTIAPADPKNPSLIKCSLLQTSLDHHPEYHALSYAWKDDYLKDEAPQSQGIALDGGNLRVGYNLATALKARRDCTDGRIPIWIDAICINQEDLNEKGIRSCECDRYTPKRLE